MEIFHHISVEYCRENGGERVETSHCWRRSQNLGLFLIFTHPPGVFSYSLIHQANLYNNLIHRPGSESLNHLFSLHRLHRRTSPQTAGARTPHVWQACSRGESRSCSPTARRFRFQFLLNMIQIINC